MTFIGIIPARYQSSRFPGKPLAILGGKTVIERVYTQAHKALEKVVVATDDERIVACVESFGGEVVMTSLNHRSGTDRVWEAYQKIAPNSEDQDIIINIQGDEPFISPEQIIAVKSCFPCQIATLAMPMTQEKEILNPNNVKVVFSETNRQALYFSRHPIPFVRNVENSQSPVYYKHIGLYAYRADILKQIASMPPSRLERLESLEQLRWLENGLSIRCALTNTATIGIDTPEDLLQAEQWLAQHNLA